MSRPQKTPYVHEVLLRKLAAGQWPEGGFLPSSRRLAAELDIAKGTAQQAVRLLARSGLVAVRDRGRVLVLPHAAERARRRLLRVAVRSQFRRLAILIPEKHLPVKDPFYRGVIRGLLEESIRRGFRPAVVGLPLWEQLKTARSLPQRGFRAALSVAFSPEYLPVLHQLAEQRFPVVVFNRRLPGLSIPAVRIDDYASAWKVAELLIGLGHRDLCLQVGVADFSSLVGTGRVEGWLACLKSHQVQESCSMPLHILLPYNLGSRPDSGPPYPAAHKFSRPTAVVCRGCASVEQLAREVQRQGLRVPRDLSVVVLEPGAVPLTPPDWPPLTFAQINMPRATQCCIEMVETMLAGNPAPPSVRFPEDLIVTESVGPPPGQRVHKT